MLGPCDHIEVPSFVLLLDKLLSSLGIPLVVYWVEEWVVSVSEPNFADYLTSPVVTDRHHPLVWPGTGFVPEEIDLIRLPSLLLHVPSPPLHSLLLLLLFFDYFVGVVMWLLITWLLYSQDAISVLTSDDSVPLLYEEFLALDVLEILQSVPHLLYLFPPLTRYHHFLILEVSELIGFRVSMLEVANLLSQLRLSVD